jgi:hypothetical protein
MTLRSQFAVEILKLRKSRLVENVMRNLRNPRLGDRTRDTIITLRLIVPSAGI